MNKQQRNGGAASDMLAISVTHPTQIEERIPRFGFPLLKGERAGIGI
jgi:hypothetical protein